MKIALVQQAKTGRADDWLATGEGLPRQGIGHTQADAIWSLVRSNLAAFGVEQIDQQILETGEDGLPFHKQFTWNQDNTNG